MGGQGGTAHVTEAEEDIAAWVDRALSSLAEELRKGSGQIAIDPSGELWRQMEVRQHVEALEVNWLTLDVISRAIVRLYHVIQTLARLTHEIDAQGLTPEARA